jgi:hypothetical protein
VIEYVFQRVTIRFVQVHPGAFFRVIDVGLLGSDEGSSKCATREQPPELYAEQKEAEDMTREIFVLLDSAASPSRVVSWNKIASIPRTAAIIVSARGSSAELDPPRADGAGEVSCWSDMSRRPTPGRSTPAPLRVTGKARRGPVRWRGLTDLPDQTCSKGSSGFSDTLVMPVRPVGGCGCCVLR